MRVVDIARKNLSRRKWRLVFNLVGISIAVAMLVSASVISHVMEAKVEEEIDKLGANIVVTPKYEAVSVSYGSIIVGESTIQENLIEKIYTIPNSANIAIVSPKLYGLAPYGNGSLLIVGILPENERMLKRWWRINGFLPDSNRNQALVGSAVAFSLGLSSGATLAVNDMQLTVIGILNETGSIDDFSVFIPLDVAQKILNKPGVVSMIDVAALCKNCPVELIAQQIMDAIPEVKAIPIKQAVHMRMEVTSRLSNISLLLASTLLIVSCVSIMNTMLASIYERIREIGIFISMGADDASIRKVFMLESLILGGIGGFLGVGIGLILSLFINPIIIDISITVEDILYNTEWLSVIPLSIATSLVVCFIASLYPAWKASTVDPVEALRGGM